jgi:hypothetical protein
MSWSGGAALFDMRAPAIQYSMASSTALPLA